MGDFLARLDDRLNPVLVKEVRQALKSRYFLIVFSFMLLAALLITSGVLVFAAFEPAKPGSAFPLGMTVKPVFIAVLVCLAFAVLLVVPAATFRALEQEETGRTYDLLVITTSTPGAIIRGKLLAAVLQLVLFFSAVVPFLAVLYMVGDVDLPSAALAFLMLFGAAALLCMFGLCHAAVVRKKRWPTFHFVLCILGLSMAFWPIIVLVGTAIGADFGRHVTTADFWYAAALILSLYPCLFAFLYVGARVAVTFESANRSTAPRVVLTILWLVGTAWTAIFWFIQGHKGEEIWAVYAGLALGLLWLVAAWLSAEDDALSRRVASEYPTSLFGRLLAGFYYPGSARGFLLLTALALLSAAIASAGISFSGSASRHELFFPPILAGYLLGYVGIPLAIMRMWLKRWIKPAHRGPTILLILVVGAALPPFAKALAGWEASAGALELVSPFLAGAELFDKKKVAGPLAIAGLGALLAIALNVVPVIKALAFRRAAPALPPQSAPAPVSAPPTPKSEGA